MTKLGVFIPCYNVEGSICEVLQSFSLPVLERLSEIVVIDNCSEDRTLVLVKELQNRNDVLGQKLVIIENAENYGLGGSQKIVYQYFLENGFTHFFSVHGDGQGDSESIAKNFLQVFYDQPGIDVIMASRFMSGGDVFSYNRLRIFGNLIFNFITFLCTGFWMTDAGTAIIFYRTDVLRGVPFGELTNSFQFNPELNILLYGLKGVKIREIPLRWKDSLDRSNIVPWKYCLDLLRILSRYFVNARLLGKPSERAFHADSQQIKPTFKVIK